MPTQTLQDNALFQPGYLVDGVWKTLDTTFDVLNPATGEVVANGEPKRRTRVRRSCIVGMN